MRHFDMLPSYALLLMAIIRSGRVVELATSTQERISPRVEIAPGAPPVLSFRLFEGQEHHRFSDLDLMVDDAGH